MAFLYLPKHYFLYFGVWAFSIFGKSYSWAFYGNGRYTLLSLFTSLFIQTTLFTAFGICLSKIQLRFESLFFSGLKI